MRKRAEDRSPGFSLLEALLSLTIFFLIFAGSLEFFGTARRVFFRLLSRQENHQAAWAALDRIRSDVLLAGRGLVRPMRLGIVAPAEEAGGRWVLVRAGAAPVLTAGPRAGETTVAVAGANPDWAGKTLCLYDRTRGGKSGYPGGRRRNPDAVLSLGLRLPDPGSLRGRPPDDVPLLGRGARSPPP
jgi:hypothetical protein